MGVVYIAKEQLTVDIAGPSGHLIYPNPITYSLRSFCLRQEQGKNRLNVSQSIKPLCTYSKKYRIPKIIKALTNQFKKCWQYQKSTSSSITQSLVVLAPQNLESASMISILSKKVDIRTPP